MISSTPTKLAVLGTGGTIAGAAVDPMDNVGYAAAQVGVAQLLGSVPALPRLLGACELVTEQVAQIDSKDMTWAVLYTLWQRVTHHLSQSDVMGVVITHGTDTLAETAYFLHCVLSPELLSAKPVVLTCAMRPASALAPDGPQNVLDAVAVALTPSASGVMAVCAGTVHGAEHVQKVDTYRRDAFDSGDYGPLAYVEEGALRQLKNWPAPGAKPIGEAVHRQAQSNDWPRVEIVMNHVGASGAMVDALLAQRAAGALAVPVLRGLVVAGTGNGTIHADLHAALRRAQSAGVQVVRASCCQRGRVLPSGDVDLFPDSQGLSAVKARIDLVLSLMMA